MGLKGPRCEGEEKHSFVDLFTNNFEQNGMLESSFHNNIL